MFILSQYTQMYQVLDFSKICNNFYDNISIAECLTSNEMIYFWGIDKHQDVAESIHKKIVSNETEYGSVEHPLSMNRTGSNETAFVSEILKIINDESCTKAGKKNNFNFKRSIL